MFSTADDPTARLGVVHDERRIADVQKLLAGSGRRSTDRAGADSIGSRRVAPDRRAPQRDSSQENRSARSHSSTDVRWHAPIPRPLKNIVCLGLNYASHVRETTRPRQADEGSGDSGVLHEGVDERERTVRSHSLGPVRHHPGRLRSRTRRHRRRRREEHPARPCARSCVRLYGHQRRLRQGSAVRAQAVVQGKKPGRFLSDGAGRRHGRRVRRSSEASASRCGSTARHGRTRPRAT